MVLTPRSVFRYYEVDGVPSSGKHEPIKAEIIQLLERIFGVSRGGWVVTQTLAELNGVTPESETDGGVVLADPDPANNGYYDRNESAWVKGRGFPDTFARVALSGSGSAQTGVVEVGVNPADIEVFFAFVGTENSGPLTLAIGGEGPREVANLAGQPLSAGEWAGTVMFALRDGKYQLLLDAGAAQAAAQSASDAKDEADRAEDEADRAENAASVASGAMSAVVLADNRFSTLAVAKSFAPEAAPDFIHIAGYFSAGDGGAALYKKVDSEPVGDKGQFSITLADGVTVAWYVLSEPTLIPQMLGARGDGTGSTPADDGVDIEGEPWNTWDGSPLITDTDYSPFWIGPTLDNPRPLRPFQNTDTWDYIGFQRALWFGKGFTLPLGDYIINLDNDRGVWNGLLIMKGQEQDIQGAGLYHSAIKTKEDASFFAGNHVGEKDYFSLMILYRTGGPGTNISDVRFEGPLNYNPNSGNLTHLRGMNINGVIIKDCWLSGGSRSVSATTSSGDSKVVGCTAEFLFDEAVYIDSSSELSVIGCNLWSSAVWPDQKGVNAEGRGSAVGCRFIQFHGHAFIAERGLFSGNYVYVDGAADPCVEIVDGGTITGNEIHGGSNTSLVHIGKNISFTGNTLIQNGPHSCLDVGDGTGGSATNNVISGNVFTKTDNSATPGNYVITAVEQGVGYFGAATPSTLIANNIINGRMPEPVTVGTATMGLNIVDGAPSS